MPIYAYKCDACGFAKDVLQKMSDDTLTECPSCGQAEFKKQVTAAGFQLKGSGWYVTDFRGDASGGAAKPDAQGAPVVPAEAGAASAPDTPPSPLTASKAPATGAGAPTAAPTAVPAASGPAPAASA